MWLFLIPLAVCLLGLYRWEWIVVGAAMGLLIFPMSLAMVYFKYAFDNEVVSRAAFQRVTLTDCALTFEYLTELKDDENSGIAQYILSRTATVNRKDIKSVAIGKKWLIINGGNTWYDIRFIKLDDTNKEEYRSIMDKDAENGMQFA